MTTLSILTPVTTIVLLDPWKLKSIWIQCHLHKRKTRVLKYSNDQLVNLKEILNEFENVRNARKIFASHNVVKKKQVVEVI